MEEDKASPKHCALSCASTHCLFFRSRPRADFLCEGFKLSASRGISGAESHSLVQFEGDIEEHVFPSWRPGMTSKTDSRWRPSFEKARGRVLIGKLMAGGGPVGDDANEGGGGGEDGDRSASGDMAGY